MLGQGWPIYWGHDVACLSNNQSEILPKGNYGSRVGALPARDFWPFVILLSGFGLRLEFDGHGAFYRAHIAIQQRDHA